MKRCAARDHKLWQAGGEETRRTDVHYEQKEAGHNFSQRFSQLVRRRSTIDKLSWAGESALRQLSKVNTSSPTRGPGAQIRPGPRHGQYLRCVPSRTDD